jgi:NADP oxidoreductase coenzyme F420-dependent
MRCLMQGHCDDGSSLSVNGALSTDTVDAGGLNMHLAIIGAGNVGAALGKGWARSGHTIAFGVPSPDNAKYAAAAQAAGAPRSSASLLR